MNHSFLCRTRKKKSRCGPSTNGMPSGPERRNPEVGKVPIPERSSGVFSVGSAFLLLRAGFSPRLSGENRLDALYI